MALKVKMAVVNPERASVTTTTDSSLKIRLNQITKQTAKRINSALSPLCSSLSLYQTDSKSAIYKIPSDDFLFYFEPWFRGHMSRVRLCLLSVNSALCVLPAGLWKLLH